eukprot:353082-Chlamydomonas_euryale.AAC.7
MHALMSCPLPPHTYMHESHVMPVPACLQNRVLQKRVAAGCACSVCACSESVEQAQLHSI